MKNRIIPVFIWLLTAAVCGCQRSRSIGVENSMFIPPTLVSTAVMTPTTSPIQPVAAAPNIDCTSQLSYVDDVTVPDGTVFKPGEKVIKTWSVENSGTCEWTSQYSLRINYGDSMSASPRQTLPRIAPGDTGEVTVTFTAPEDTGSYYSSWSAYDSRGKAFGDDIYIEIIVSPAVNSE